jgi:sugar lactone lactonase YvrE
MTRSSVAHRILLAVVAFTVACGYDGTSPYSQTPPPPPDGAPSSTTPRDGLWTASGALWVSDGNANRIAKYGAAKLAASGAPAPDVVISGGASTLQAPAGLAFDADGRLWVANGERRDVVAFGAAQLVAGGSVAPAIVLVPSNRSVSVPTGLAFDDAGALWVVSGDGLLARYDRLQLTASGEPSASASLRVDAHVMLWSLAFWPKVRGLPIN